ncbi:hypothetical protein FRC10_012005 [Ceratobasidium sp. 414]|nr:hypothetical protein FRC10_012005 [Ceratobasidium sp. 414]
MDMTELPGSWITPQRMPPGITVLHDMQHWSCVELDSWISLLRKSQNGELPAHEIFDMLQVLWTGSRPPLSIQGTPLPDIDPSEHKWTSEELLYTEHMVMSAKEADADACDFELAGLPPAQKTHIYAPFMLDLFQALMTLHKDHADMISLAKETVCMEAEGPVHE